MQAEPNAFHIKLVLRELLSSSKTALLMFTISALQFLSGYQLVWIPGGMAFQSWTIIIDRHILIPNINRILTNQP